MRFQEAVVAHRGWRLRLARYLGRPDGSLQVAAVRQDTRCELGQWLHGEGQSFHMLDEYKRLLAAHARLHRSASELVHKANLGERMSSEAAMSDRSPFGIAASELATALERLRTRTGL